MKVKRGNVSQKTSGVRYSGTFSLRGVLASTKGKRMSFGQIRKVAAQQPATEDNTLTLQEGARTARQTRGLLK